MTHDAVPVPTADEVRIEVVAHAAGVTICAVYPAEGNSCEPGDEGRLRSRNNDVKVDFTVMVPAGMAFVGRTVNGGVKAIDLTGDVEARTVNGNITLATSGYARAKTVNGSIRAEFGSVRLNPANQRPAQPSSRSTARSWCWWQPNFLIRSHGEREL